MPSTNPTLADPSATLGIERRFSSDRHPFKDVQWEKRDALIRGSGDKPVFEQRGVQFPASWSQTAVNITAQKYFRGQLGSDLREWSVKQLIGRVVEKIGEEGTRLGYFADDAEQRTFEHELAYILLHQMAAFNSPVWFNIGVRDENGNLIRQTPSACFILSVDDNMESIFEWNTTEGTIFRAGSGSGVNLSRIRGSMEPLSGGGTASGPVSFMRGADAWAGTIKSGGKCLAPWQQVYTERGPVEVRELAESGEDFVVLSYDPPAGRYKAKTARAWKEREQKAVVRVQTDKGKFDLSVDHPVKLSSGETILAGDLKTGMSLFAGHVKRNGDYLEVGLRDGQGGRELFHRMIARDVIGLEVDGRSVHHIDEDPSNNHPSNLTAKTQAEHARDHNLERVAAGDHVFQKRRFPKTGTANAMHREGAFWDDETRSAAYRDLQRDRLIERGDAVVMQEAAARQRMINTAFKVINAGYEIDTFDAYVQGRKQVVGRIASVTGLRAKIDDRFGSYDAFVREVSAANHRVVSVEQLGVMDVYDVEVDCPTPDDKSPMSGHNFLIWDSEERTGSGIVAFNTRRAAKMIVLDVDHPDIIDFIECKALEEDKIQALADAGFSVQIGTPEGDRTLASVQYQNANNSVRVTDEFMRAVENDEMWQCVARTTGEPIGEPMPAREVWEKIAEAAHRCADPGVQYDTTINNWHTCPNHSPIRGSNPCCAAGDTLVVTDEGLVRIDELERRWLEGEPLPAVSAWDLESDEPVMRRINRVWVAGHATELVEVRTAQGLVLRFTPEHRFLTGDGAYVEAQDLTEGVELRSTADAYGSVDADRVASVTRVPADEAVYDLETDGTHNFAVTSGDATHSIVVHNSEYMHVDDSSCNLASLNLQKFRCEDGTFDVESFEHAVRVMFTAQEILIGFGAYPTEAIKRNTRAMRQIGLGFANVGAFLMADGLPYDSDEGRAKVAAITSLMTATAYHQSAVIAGRMGPYDEYEANKDAHLKVMRMHRAESRKVARIDDDKRLSTAHKKMWEEAVKLGEANGYRNAQASVAAPTGTISFLMDCDTTGIEPDFSLIKYKDLVGGGQIVIANQTVPEALRKLGYTPQQINDISAHIEQHNSVLEAPHLADEHKPVFACAVGDQPISWQGHVKMMAACQPFLSGAISKTVNMPNDATVQDIADAYMMAWKLGVKALAIYRDGSKTQQPLGDGKSTPLAAAEDDPYFHSELGDGLKRGVKRGIDKNPPSRAHQAVIGGLDLLINVHEFEDGTPGRVQVTMAQSGSTLRGMFDTWAVTLSEALRYGAPLEDLIEKLSLSRFEPNGFTDNPDIGSVKSIPDYVMKFLAINYLPPEHLAELLPNATAARIQAEQEAEGELTTTELPPAPPVAALPAAKQHKADKPDNGSGPRRALRVIGMGVGTCDQCGGLARQSGACMVCENCGAQGGCG